MILGSLKNSGVAEKTHPLIKEALDYIKAADYDAIFASESKIELRGKDLFLFGSEYQGKTREQARVEAHRKYIDIQIAVEGTEQMGWIDVSGCSEVLTPYNPEKDVVFYTGPVSTYFTVSPGEFAVFFPEDAHQPSIGEGKMKKIIVKVLL